MFKSLLLISCLGLFGCHDKDSVTEPTAAESKVWVGDAWEGNLDRLASERYTVITGSLIIRDSQIDTIDLPYLQSIGDWLTIYNNASLTNIDLPQLATVGALSIDNNASLTNIDLPQLETVSDDVYIYKHQR